MSPISTDAEKTEGNSQAAQDVKDMLAELQGSEQPQADTEAAAATASKSGVEDKATEADKAPTDVASTSNQKATVDGKATIDEKVNVNESSAGKTDSSGKDNANATTTKPEQPVEGKGENEDAKTDATKTDENETAKNTDKGDSTNHRSTHGRGRGRGGARGGGDRKNFKENMKSEFTAQEETDDPVLIRKQVEFYFSDSNLPMDRFLLSQTGGSENRPVELSVLHSFKRMRHFQPFSAIVAALRDSTFLDLTEDDTKVKRKVPFSKELKSDAVDRDAIQHFEDRAAPRSIYAKGFGAEDKDTQLDIEAFFTGFGQWNAVRLRRANDKMFKGSVFVEFDSEETQKKFLATDPKPQYKGKDLQIMGKKEYCDKKVEDIKSGKIKAHSYDPKRRGGFQNGNKRKQDNEDNRDWKQRRDDDNKNGHRGRGRGRGRGGNGRGGRKPWVNPHEAGIPTVLSTLTPDEEKNLARVKRETATADALAQAKKIVAAESAKKEGEKQTDDNDSKAQSKKRSREDSDQVEGGAEPKLKKVDSKDKAQNGAGEKESMEA